MTTTVHTSSGSPDDDWHDAHDAASRVRAFLNEYPHDGQTNVDPEKVYAFNMVPLNWSDLDALCKAVGA